MLGSFEVGIILRLSRKTAVKLMRSGKIKSFPIHGRLWRTTRADLATYIEKEFNDESSAASRRASSLVERLELEVESLKRTLKKALRISSVAPPPGSRAAGV
jgi:hypothetical protein